MGIIVKLLTRFVDSLTDSSSISFSLPKETQGLETGGL